jgi:hypothetical protein
VLVRKPHARYLATRSAAEPPEHPYERAVWNVVHEYEADEGVARALEIYLSEPERETLTAWFIARASDAELAQHLRLSEEVTKPYRHLFFDVNVFRDELDVIRWVREYEKTGTDYGAKLVQNAQMFGVDYLAWLHSRGALTLDPDTVQRNIMADSYFRGRQSRNFPLGSKEATMALQFMGTAYKAAQTIGQTKGPDMKGLLIKLRYRDETQPVTEVLKTEEILH